MAETHIAIHVAECIGEAHRHLLPDRLGKPALAALVRLFLHDYEEGELDTPDGHERRCTTLKYAVQALVGEESKIAKHLVLVDLIAKTSGYIVPSLPSRYKNT